MSDLINRWSVIRTQVFLGTVSEWVKFSRNLFHKFIHKYKRGEYDSKNTPIFMYIIGYEFNNMTLSLITKDYHICKPRNNFH